jgi:hypothetical protein
MLQVFSSPASRDCSGFSRREAISVGSLGLAGLGAGSLGLADLLRAKAAAPAAFRDKSIVLLFLTGGPSQVETFDPKMTAPAEVRSVTGELKTSLPGVTFGATFPRLARLAHRMAVVRSFTHGNSNHTGGAQDVMRGGAGNQVGMGSIVTRLRGTSHPTTGIPTQVYLSHREPDPQFNKERLRLLEAATAGELGAAFAPFDPLGDGPVNQNLTLNLPSRRLADRRTLRQSLDRLARSVDVSGMMEGLDRFEQQAFNLLLGKGRRAFDLTGEDPALIRRYDTGRFNTALRVKTRHSTLGHQMLMARRLCEAGCGFITVHNPGWDMHGGNTQFNIPFGMERLGRPVDQAVSVFLEDLEQRGLSDKVLLIITGEFGRTPKVKADGGRDHWPKLSTLAFSGGGLPMGQVIGRSNRNAGEPASRPVSPEDLFATILATMFDIGELRLLPEVPRDVARLIERAQPIPELAG